MNDVGSPKYFVDGANAPKVKQMEGVETRILTGFKGENMMMVLTSIQPGREVPEHAHVFEQIGYIVSGKAVMAIGGEERDIQTGDSYGIPPDVPHSAKCVGREQIVFLDVFHPSRKDFLEKAGR